MKQWVRLKNLKPDLKLSSFLQEHEQIVELITIQGPKAPQSFVKLADGQPQLQISTSMCKDYLLCKECLSELLHFEQVRLVEQSGLGVVTCAPASSVLQARQREKERKKEKDCKKHSMFKYELLCNCGTDLGNVTRRPTVTSFSRQDVVLLKNAALCIIMQDRDGKPCRSTLPKWSRLWVGADGTPGEATPLTRELIEHYLASQADPRTKRPADDLEQTRPAKRHRIGIPQGPAAPCDVMNRSPSRHVDPAGEGRQVASSEKKQCFMPYHQFRTPENKVVAAADLAIDSKFIDYQGNAMEVTWCQKHPENQRLVVDLHTKSSMLTVTGSHRIPVPHGEVKEAKALMKNDEVWVPSSVGASEKLRKVTKRNAYCDGVELEFAEDAAIPVWVPPILTKGRDPSAVAAASGNTMCKEEQEEREEEKAIDDGSIDAEPWPATDDGY